MSKRDDIRRLAMQVLYQIDVTGQTDRDTLLGDVDEAYNPEPVRARAVELALEAWSRREQADRYVAELTPAWPTHRQPAVDRAILRLAYAEMAGGHAPVKVAINEAVELAKRFAGQASPAFINGVLDKLARRLESENAIPPQPDRTPHPSQTDNWLDDAVNPAAPPTPHEPEE